LVTSYAAGKKYVHTLKKFRLLISMKAKGGAAKTVIKANTLRSPAERQAKKR